MKFKRERRKLRAVEWAFVWAIIIMGFMAVEMEQGITGIVVFIWIMAGVFHFVCSHSYWDDEGYESHGTDKDE